MENQQGGPPDVASQNKKHPVVSNIFSPIISCVCQMHFFRLLTFSGLRDKLAENPWHTL